MTNSGNGMSVTCVTKLMVSGAAQDVRLHCQPYEESSRNDEALVYARDFMANVGTKTRGDNASTNAITTPDPAALARSLRTRFEGTAVTVAAWCALLAHSEGSDASYQTWKQVFARLYEGATPG